MEKLVSSLTGRIVLGAIALLAVVGTIVAIVAFTKGGDTEEQGSQLASNVIIDEAKETAQVTEIPDNTEIPAAAAVSGDQESTAGTEAQAANEDVGAQQTDSTTNTGSTPSGTSNSSANENTGSTNANADSNNVGSSTNSDNTGSDNTGSDSTSGTEGGSETTDEVAEYYKANSEVVAVIKATESENLQTESAASELMASRGFDTYAVYCSFNMDGSKSMEEVTEGSEEKHPSYMTYYISDAGDVWTIYAINGSVMAYPVSYNLESNRGVELLISETDTLTSYDNIGGQFYVTRPNATGACLKTVTKITAETLNSLSREEIDKL